MDIRAQENRPAPAAAWLLRDVSVDDPESVIAELLKVPGVVNAHPVLGRYDMIVYKAEAASTDELMQHSGRSASVQSKVSKSTVTPDLF